MSDKTAKQNHKLNFKEMITGARVAADEGLKRINKPKTTNEKTGKTSGGLSNSISKQAQMIYDKSTEKHMGLHKGLGQWEDKINKAFAPKTTNQKTGKTSGGLSGLANSIFKQAETAYEKNKSTERHMGLGKWEDKINEAFPPKTEKRIGLSKWEDKINRALAPKKKEKKTSK